MNYHAWLHLNQNNTDLYHTIHLAMLSIINQYFFNIKHDEYLIRCVMGLDKSSSCIASGQFVVRNLLSIL